LHRNKFFLLELKSLTDKDTVVAAAVLVWLHAKAKETTYFSDEMGMTFSFVPIINQGVNVV
jgi:hypothetical protein